MPWVKLDEWMPEHDKLVGLSDRAFRVHVRALAYCNRRLTDGHIPPDKARAWKAAKAHIEELIAAKLWEKNGDGGWVIHDYLEYQPARSDVEKIRAKRAAAGALGGSKRAANRNGDA